MPKGVAKDALANSGTADTLSSGLTGNAASIYGGLAPELQSEAAHPAGFTPSQVASQNTAAQQSAGGSQAGTVGQGGLYAARTKNAGAAQNAIGAGTRGAGANLSKAAVGVQNNQADLQQKQKQEGIAGLGGLYSEELGGGEKALGLSNEALQAATQADANNPWMKVLQSGIAAGGQVGAAALTG
jgi:hypothetical protein